MNAKTVELCLGLIADIKRSLGCCTLMKRWLCPGSSGDQSWHNKLSFVDRSIIFSSSSEAGEQNLDEIDSGAAPPHMEPFQALHHRVSYTNRPSTKSSSALVLWLNGRASDYESGGCRFDPCQDH